MLTDTAFDYNLQGRLETITIDTFTNGSISKREVTEYEYNDMGIRVSAQHTVDEGNDSKLEVDETTTYLNDPMNFTGYSQVFEEYTYDNLTTSDVETILYTLGYDQLNQVRYDTSTPSGQILYFLTDGHGSVQLLVDDVADLVEQYAYDSYGPALQTFVIQLCGPGTYIPTQRAVEGGGYSAIIESNDVGPEGGQVLVERTLEEFRELFAE